MTDPVCGIEVLDRKIEDIHSRIVQVGDIQPRWSEMKDTSGMTCRILDRIECSHGEFRTTQRFLTSMCSRFRISPAIFHYFKPDEVFERIQITHPQTKVRLTTDRDSALAISGPQKAIVNIETIRMLLASRGKEIEDIRYHDGVVTSTHRMAEAPWEINGDCFEQRFIMETPMDGYGNVNVYLSLLRLVCQNGMIGYNPSFRSEVQLGQNIDTPIVPLTRILDSFNNEEGFAALRQRLEVARKSPASVAEVQSLKKALVRSLDFDLGSEAAGIMSRLTQVTGDVSDLYGIASIDSITTKKQRLLPMKCSLYDLINTMTELTTHRRELLQETRRIHAWIGELVSHEYDLEGTLEDASESPAFYFN